MWDIFFLPKLTNHRRQSFCQNDLPQTEIPAIANMTSHEQNHCVSFFVQITVFFVWLLCVRASPCRVAGSIPVKFLTAFCSHTSPCRIARGMCFPLLLTAFSFACVPLSNAEHLNRGYNPCLHTWCRCEPRSARQRSMMKFLMKKKKCECVRLCALCLCLVVERRGICDYCVCPLLY